MIEHMKNKKGYVDSFIGIGLGLLSGIGSFSLFLRISNTVKPTHPLLLADLGIIFTGIFVSWGVFLVSSSFYSSLIKGIIKFFKEDLIMDGEDMDDGIRLNEEGDVKDGDE